MTDFCIQIHPQRAADLDLAGLFSLCNDLARKKDLIRRFAIVDGTDGHDHVNLMFETRRPGKLWSVLQSRLYQSGEFGGALKQCSMAMCQGAHGWDDYLLLHHYDPAVPCARLAEE